MKPRFTIQTDSCGLKKLRSFTIQTLTQLPQPLPSPARFPPAAMAGGGGKLLSKALSFIHPPPLRSLSTAAVAGTLAPNRPAAEARRRTRQASPFCVSDYLIHTCGLSKNEAAAASPALAHLRSPDKPDAVLRFLRDRGLAGDEIAAFVSRRPRLLCMSLEKDHAAKFDFLVSVGFSASEVAMLFQKSNLLRCVSLSAVKRRVEFLRGILDSDLGLTKVIKKAIWTLTGAVSIQKRMVDNISKLRGWGVPCERTKALLVLKPRFFQLKSEIIDDAAAVAEGEFGISRRSKMFVYAVVVLCSQHEAARQAKYEVFERFGWKKSDIVALFRTYPSCFTMGDATLAKNLEFLMNKAGFSASYILKCASMLGMSLERRVCPRYELLTALRAKSIPCDALNFYSVACLSEKKFQRRYVNEFMKLEPDACLAYMSSISLKQDKN